MMLTFEIGDRENEINVFTCNDEHKNKEGDEYAADSRSLLYNHKRILPAMGEFHYSRWEDEVGLQVFLRIGPWVHAEVRNGGFPDWVQRAKDYEPRTNDEGYLKAVEKYFNQLGKQLEGLMFKDGGPIIGVQLENEYGHVGGPKDPKIRYAHMKVLYALARKAGFLVPIYRKG